MIEVQRSIARMRLRHLPDLAGSATSNEATAQCPARQGTRPLARKAPTASSITSNISNPFNTMCY